MCFLKVGLILVSMRCIFCTYHLYLCFETIISVMIWAQMGLTLLVRCLESRGLTSFRTESEHQTQLCLQVISPPSFLLWIFALSYGIIVSRVAGLLTRVLTVI